MHLWTNTGGRSISRQAQSLFLGGTPDEIHLSGLREMDPRDKPTRLLADPDFTTSITRNLRHQLLDQAGGQNLTTSGTISDFYDSFYREDLRRVEDDSIREVYHTLRTIWSSPKELLHRILRLQNPGDPGLPRMIRLRELFNWRGHSLPSTSFKNYILENVILPSGPTRVIQELDFKMFGHDFHPMIAHRVGGTYTLPGDSTLHAVILSVALCFPDQGTEWIIKVENVGQPELRYDFSPSDLEGADKTGTIYRLGITREDREKFDFSVTARFSSEVPLEINYSKVPFVYQFDGEDTRKFFHLIHPQVATDLARTLLPLQEVIQAILC